LEQCIEAWARQSAPASESQSKEDWAKLETPKNGFWLHARNLIEFFKTPASDSRTAAADHFTTEVIHYEMPSKEMKNKINDQISHLNYDRLTDFGKLTFDDAIRIKGQIDRAVAKFQIHLRAEARSLWQFRNPTEVQIVEHLSQQNKTSSYLSQSFLRKSDQTPISWKGIAPNKKD
jgi:hypothetical protein